MTETEKMVGLPEDLQIVRFASARAREIGVLTNLIENPKTTKLIFQKLPCHMRRRAMSHNPNRMPRKLREAHKNQMEKSGEIKQPKRPRRKYRRRPSRLQEEYKKRSSKHTWLETHIWHAKRFHMKKKWDNHLPDKSCARSHRFCYRSLAQHCILMDISYLCCIEIKGLEKNIVTGLSSLCDTKVGLTFAAATFIKGNREGRVMVFKREKSRDPIGLVSFLWRYDDPQTDDRALWIWIHPAFYLQLLDEIQSSFSPEMGVKVARVQLNRFRLRGPKADTVVSALLKPESQAIVNSLPPGFVVGVEVRDPRTVLPQSRRDKTEQEAKPTAPSMPFVPESSRSTLWDSTVREEIAQLRKSLPDHVMNKRRGEILVPGSELPIQPDERPIPILITKASNEGKSVVHGYDIILPAGWATAFWLPLIYSGGHAGGLKDAASMNYEYQICRDLTFEIDSDAGKAAAEERKMELMDEYFRKPPKTRTNFIKLATPSPFINPWSLLLDNWMDREQSSFVVLRDRRLFQSLSLQKPFTLSDSILAEPLLVPVTVRVRHGRPYDFSMICLPLKDDKVSATIIEPVHLDPASKERKALRIQHQSDLKALAKKRKANEKNPDKKEEHNSAPIIATFREKMRTLWMPPKCNLKTSFARPIAGFVMQGDYGLAQGQGVGRGYLVARSLPLVRQSLILVRNPGTNLYMWADIEIGF